MADKTILTAQEVNSVVRPEEGQDYFTGYANGVSVAHTFFDFQLHFSEIKIKNAQQVEAEMFATILMSPQHAKLFVMHLQQNLELYEQKFGEIKVPDNLIQKSENVDVDLSHVKL